MAEIFEKVSFYPYKFRITRLSARKSEQIFSRKLPLGAPDGGFRVKAGAPRSGDLFLFNVNSNFLCLE